MKFCMQENKIHYQSNPPPSPFCTILGQHLIYPLTIGTSTLHGLLGQIFNCCNSENCTENFSLCQWGDKWPGFHASGHREQRPPSAQAEFINAFIKLKVCLYRLQKICGRVCLKIFTWLRKFVLKMDPSLVKSWHK